MASRRAIALGLLLIAGKSAPGALAAGASDARVAGALGGTGHAFDWSLVVGLARRRKLVLAGGLTPENVRSAVELVRPWCVDVASGVESAPGVKDLGRVRAFVEAVRAPPES